MQKEIIEKYIEDKMTVKQMAEKSGLLVGKVRYWMQRHGLKPVFSREFGVGAKRIWTDEQMLVALCSSNTIAEALRKVGLKVRPGNYSTVKFFVQRNDINLSHMTGKFIAMGRNKVASLESVMTENSTYSRHHLKKRLIDNCLLINKCCICGLSPQWNNKNLVMVLDHINGVNNDNRMENLRLLCPNCNSQQSTFCGKGKKSATPRAERGRCLGCNTPIWETSLRCAKCLGLMLRRADRPCKESLEKMISSMTWVDIGKKYGVSDNAVKKWARQYGIDYAPRKLM